MTEANDVVDFNFKKFPAKIYRDFKAGCAVKGVSMKSELEEVMKNHFAKKKKGGG